MQSPLVKKYGKEKRWVNWKKITREGKTTKIPYFSRGRKASSTDPKTWKTHAEAEMDFDNGANRFDGVGIVLHDSKLICIDIDHVLQDGEIYHPQAETILDLLKASNTFTEISQSGEGLHLFFETKTPFVPIANKKAPFEIYSVGRYIATTNTPFKKALDIRVVTEEEILQILSIIGYPFGADKKDSNDAPSSARNDLLVPEQEALTDEAILQKMFKSQNGDKTKRLYDGDTSEHENDESKADAALCAHLAFWTGKDAAQMERIWIQSPLGKREKTQKRKDYRDRTIRNAIKNCKEVYKIPEGKLIMESPVLDLLFIVDSKGNRVYLQNTENMARILRRHPNFKDRLRYDSFKNMIEFRDEGAEEWRNMIDSDSIALQTKISILFPYFGKVGKEMVYDAMILVARENTYDSAIAYIQSLKWDGEKRLDSWLSNVYHVPNDAYHKAVGSNWLKGLVKRIVEPGCKFDYVLVLEGEQGTKKSTSLSIIGQILPKYNIHVETTMSTDSKDFFMQFQGKAIIEFSEGETLSRTEVKRMKAIITTQIDKYRPAYGRTSEDFPRRCVFAMTTNQSEYLKDETGNRRWLPVACEGDADIEWLKENKDQLYAEAYERLKAGETVYEFPDDETRSAQAARRIEDPNEELVMNWYINLATLQQKEEGVSIQDVYAGAFLGNFSTNGRGLDRAKQMSIATTLKDRLGLTRKRSEVRGVNTWRYFDDKRKYMKKTFAEELIGDIPTLEEMQEHKGDKHF